MRWFGLVDVTTASDDGESMPTDTRSVHALALRLGPAEAERAYEAIDAEVCADNDAYEFSKLCQIVSVSKVATAVIAGLGGGGYTVAVRARRAYRPSRRSEVSPGRLHFEQRCSLR